MTAAMLRRRLQELELWAGAARGSDLVALVPLYVEALRSAHAGTEVSNEASDAASQCGEHLRRLAEPNLPLRAEQYVFVRTLRDELRRVPVAELRAIAGMEAPGEEEEELLDYTRWFHGVAGGGAE